MDLYIDIIPDDHGEEIRARVRERDGSDSEEERPARRARADTDALLPPGGDGREVEEPPKPEDGLDKFDRERLQKGLRYINEAAKRKITPRTQEFLKLHKDAYKSALAGGAPEEASRASPGPGVLLYCVFLQATLIRGLINEWAQRNRILHDQICQYISDRHWGRLAEQVCRDPKELLNVAPDSDTAANYEKVILSIQNES